MNDAINNARGWWNVFFGDRTPVTIPQPAKRKTLEDFGWVKGSDNIYRQPSPSPIPTPVYNQSGLGRNPDISKKPMTEQVKNAILNAAKEFNLPSSLLFDVGYGEGGFRADARNTSPEGIKAGIPTGLFQFTPNTWEAVANYAANPQSSLKNWDKSFVREDPVANARAAAYLISRGQLAKWAASVSNWGRFYNDEELAPYFVQSPGWKGLPKK